MIAAPAMVTEPAARSPAPAEPEGKTPQVGTGDAFARLMSAVQSGFGGYVCVAAGGLHHEAAVFNRSPVSPHQARLQQMADRAEARVTGGRHSRLDPGLPTDGAGTGPRGHRLALESQEQAGRLAAENANRVSTARTHLGEPATGTETKAVAQHTNAAPPRAEKPSPDALSDQAVRQHKPAKMETLAPGAVQRDTAVSPGRPAEPSHPLTGAPAGPGGVDAVRSPVRSAPVARQIAEVLAVRAGGGQSARAVSGTEQSGSARPVAGTSNSSQTGNRPGKAVTAKAGARSAPGRPSPESTQRSAFNRLVRSLRLNVGGQRSTARLHLRPPELGRIRIDARMDGPRLQVLVQTETTAARELLRSRAADLQAALEQHGVKVERFEFAPIGLQDQQNHTAMFAGAGDPNARRSAWQRDEHQAADRGEPNRVPGDDQHAGPAEPEGTEAIYSAAAETRLDVRV